MNSNLQIRLLMWLLLSLQPGLWDQHRTGTVLWRGLGMRMCPPCFWSLCTARGEVDWQALQGIAALQVIGSLTAPTTLAPLLSQVCRTQIQRYQRAPEPGKGPELAAPAFPAPIAHVEQWVDVALLRCQIISGHRHRRTLQGAALGAMLRIAAGSWDPSRCACCLPGTLSPSLTPASSPLPAVRHPARGEFGGNH